jgi:hypothetical protein
MAFIYIRIDNIGTNKANKEKSITNMDLSLFKKNSNGAANHIGGKIIDHHFPDKSISPRLTMSNILPINW